jgi:hypothetical protein
MITDDRWNGAGTEPRLAEILSDPTALNLMRADGVNADDVTAVIDRMRARIRPLDFIPSEQIEAPASVRRDSKFPRALPLQTNQESVNLHAVAGVVSRWIASLAKD